MGRAPCCDKDGLKKGPWTPEEDQKLMDYIKRHGHGSWRALPKHAGLLRCGKSCRLRWTNYLRPDIKRGKFSFEEEQTIIQLHGVMGNKWSAIAGHLPGRTDNEIKNYWNTHLKKRLLQMGIDPVTHRPRMDLFDFSNMSHFLGAPSLSHMTARWENARLQEAMTREYMRIYAALIQQQADQYNHSAGGTISPDLLLRSHLENPLSRPDANLINNYIMSQTWAQNPENQQGSLEYNAQISQVIEQFQAQAQIMKNVQYSSPTSTLNGLSTPSNIKLENQGIITNDGTHDQATLLPEMKFNTSEAYDNMVNSSLILPTMKSQDLNPLLWPEDNLYRMCKSDSESVPALISSTSSPNIFSDSDLVADNSSSSMLNMNMSSTTTSSPTATNNNGSYAFPPEFLLDFPENSKQKEALMSKPASGSASSSSWQDVQNYSEDGRDYWCNMLKYVAENTVTHNSGFESMGAQ
ncbi:hypothetical protein SUGI_0655470 [Cryptomeria japonica]|uniref:transcription factor MYB74 n=1 Tax=Cryptomeria japonica TaxID=3369 RepID=UPI0024146BD4|nr:transcription factor MYB74 [Cryptomeria japonica]GLJ32580.1 hypothetical protein SUGI_0655470 [Cryptomeria japonica]